MVDQGGLGVSEVSEKLYGQVTRYHAQIGHRVPRDTLNELEWRLLSEAKDLFHRAMYEEALNTFTHCLAVTEKTRSHKELAVRGAIVHNIASCLHHLGELEAAQEYYEQAIQSFNRAETPMMERLLHGNTNKRRVDFVKERLIDISWGRKPDADKFLDENGVKRPVPQVPAGVPTGNATSLSVDWAESQPPPPWAQAKDKYERVGAGPSEHRPGWLTDDNDDDSYLPSRSAAHNATSAAAAVYDPYRQTTKADEAHAAKEADEDNDVDDETQERARKEWLQYYLQIGNWREAAELVVTAEEREDLDYLRQRELRLGSDLASAADDQGHGDDDLYQLNDAAVSARSRAKSGNRGDLSGKLERPRCAAAAASDDDDEGML